MNAGASIANALWLASSLGAARSFNRALADPRRAQEEWLRAQLERHAECEFGRSHDFRGIRDADEFARRVPLSDYADVEAQVERIRRGQRDVLACGRVTHLAPTSGSSGARKLIPFSASLQNRFSSAVGAWMHDLVRQRPALVGGPAYWSVSPLSAEDGEDAAPGHRADTAEPAKLLTRAGTIIPIGFADDADYLGAGSAWLVRRALAAPSSIRHVREASAFWCLTMLALLRRRDLRLISIWHPSFLDLLVAAAEENWATLLDAVASGECPWAEALPPGARHAWRVAPDRARAAELRRDGRGDWPGWWPRLQVLSCWGEQAAEPGWNRLVQRLPHVLVQAKGLLATEAVVTIPLGTEKPLAVTAHFFEFLDERGDVRRAHDLLRGERYEVVVTNGGGLWRYRLGDVVECTGHVLETPSLRFLGRAGRVSDLRGEKLSEPFVSEVLRALWDGDPFPAYAALRPWEDRGRAGYELLLSAGDMATGPAKLGERLEAALRANPHYALARRLGQLDALRVVPVAENAGLAELATHRGRLGDAKPRVLLAGADSVA